MKKILLSFAAVALTAAASMADVHTLVFDGTNDMYGLARQSDVNTTDWVGSFSFSEAGIDFAIDKNSDVIGGFALINDGGNNAGLAICSEKRFAITPAVKISLSVPNGKITGTKIILSGYALSSMEINFNGTPTDGKSEGSSLYAWSWNDSEGSEDLTLEWGGTFGIRYIRSIEVVYTRDLGGKQECGLAFNETSAEVIMEHENVYPVLDNPNNLPLTWSSSDESVATVDAEGKVTLLKGGTTTITVETPGNDEFAPGNVRYELTVVAVAASLAQMKERAPEIGGRVFVECPLTVTFANGPYAFVIDAEGTASYIEDTRNQGSTQTSMVTIYKVGNVIPAGWIATNATIYEALMWAGLPEAVTETVEVTYPEVDAVTPADVDRVVTLMNVTFDKRTATENTKAFGTTPDGTRYEFQNTYDISVMDPGTYDVTGIVRYSKRGSTVFYYIAPIKYTVSQIPDSGVEVIADGNSAARYYNLQGVEVTDPKGGIFVKVVDGKATKVMVK